MTKAKILISIGLILMVTFLSFYPSLRNGFVNWDDNVVLTENTQIQNLSWLNIKNIFTSFFLGTYIPLVRLSYALEYYFFLLNPLIYHLNNLILHLLNSLLVLWLILLVSNKISVSLAAAIFFGIHPLHVESVAWVTERKDVLYGFFFLGALLSYIYYIKKRDKKYYFVSILLFILSLFSKSMAITLPLVLFLIDYILEVKFEKKSFGEKIPFLIISLVFVTLTLYGLYVFKSLRQAPSLPFYYYIFFANYGLVFYLCKLILPVKLSCFYPYPQDISSFSALIFLILPAVTVTLTLLVIISKRYTKKIIFGSLFFLITILPVIQILPNSKTIAADRYTYLPLLGLFYITAEYFSFLCLKNFRYKLFKKFLLIILIVITGSLSFLTFHRCQVWKDSIMLWNDVLKKYPDVDLAYNSRGTAYFYKGDYDLAISDYTRAIKLYPFSEVFYNNRATAYIYKGEYDRSISDYTKALRIKPDYALAYHGRGFVYATKGNYERAIADYNRALSIKPTDASVYIKRGLAYAKRGEYEQAVSDYTQAIKLSPVISSEHVLAHTNRATAYIYKRDYDRAIADYTQILKLNPKLTKTRYNRAKAYSEKGDDDRAISDYTQALRIKPDYAEAYYNRGVAYSHKREYNRAISNYTQAIRIKPDFADAYINRGNDYSRKGDYDWAVSDYTQALRIDPDMAEAYNNRAVAYLAQKDYGRARLDVQKAQKLGYKIEAGFLELLHDRK